MFGGFGPQDPYGKMAMRTAGLTMLMGGDPSSTLQNIPELMMQAKKMQMQKELEERKLAMDQKQLEQTERRIRLEKRVQDREDKKLTDQQTFGRAMGKYDLDQTKRYDGDPTRVFQNDKDGTYSEGAVQSTPKSDRAVPYGDEGNPFSEKIMQLPLPIRQGMAQAPLSASQFGDQALQQSGKDIFDTTSETRVPKPHVLRSPDGKQKWEGDLNNQQDYMEYHSLTGQGWTTAPNEVDQTNRAPDLPKFEEDIDKRISEDMTAATAASDQADRFDEFAGYAMDPSLYTGTGGNLVAGLTKAGQNIAGLFPGVDVGKMQTMQKMIPEMVQHEREQAVRDQSMSNQDREFYIGSVANVTNDAAGISMMAARKRGLAEYKRARVSQITRWRREGLSPSEAVDKWEEEKAPEAREKFMGQEAVSKRMLRFQKKGGTLLDYIQRNSQGVKDRATELMNGDPTEQGGIKQLSKENADQEYDALPSGAQYRDPDGNLRTKR